jgi:hypothetical protein
MNAPQPPPALPAMTSYELSRARRELTQALKSLPTSAAGRTRIQQQLTAVIAEQEARTQITASDPP